MIVTKASQSGGSITAMGVREVPGVVTTFVPGSVINTGIRVEQIPTN